VRTLVSGNLVLGAVGYVLVFLLLLVDLSSTRPGEVESNDLWFLPFIIAGFIGCILLWRQVHDEDDWDYTSTAKKWLCFFITPWGLILGLGVGLVIVGLMVLMGGGGSSGGSGGGLSYQEKKDIRESVEWGVRDAIRKS
jgi:hypothetical protein